MPQNDPDTTAETPNDSDTDASNGSTMTTVAFVCVQNAGRSQMATAFAERERADRGLDAEIEIVSGGTRPADHVHEVVVDAMNEIGIDLSDRVPRTVTADDLADAEYVITMGCDAEAVCPAGFGGENRDWGLDDPDDAGIEGTREIRDEIERRVVALFDELGAAPES